MRRIALRSLAALAVVVLVVAVVAVWAVGTASGTRLVFRLAAPMMPESLSVASVEGRLAGEFALNDVSFRSDTLALSVRRIEGDWQPRALLSGGVEFDRILLSGVDAAALDAARSASDETAEPFSLPESLDLPLDVHVRELSVREAVYRPGPDASPLVIDHVRLAAQWTEAELELVIEEGEGPRFGVTGEMRLVPRTPYDASGELRWIVRPPGYADVSGVTEISGTLRSLLVMQQIDAPYGIDAEVRMENLFAELLVDGGMSFELAVGGIGGGLPDVTMTGELSLEGAPSDLELSLDTDLVTPDFGPMHLDARVHYGPDGAAVRTFELLHPESGAAVTAAGSVTLGDSPRVDLSADWSGLRWPVSGDADFASQSGEAALEGRLDDFSIRIAGDLTAHELPGRFAVSGTGSAESLELDTIEIDGLGGRVTGNASARFGSTVGGMLSLEIEDVDPAALAAGWSGEIDGEIRAGARLEGESIHAEIERFSLTGRARDRDVALSASGLYTGETVEITTLDLRSGMSRLEGSGQIGAALDAVVSLRSPDLGDFWPGLGGELTLDATVRGPRVRPDIELDATGSELVLDGIGAGHLAVSADVAGGGEGNSSVEIELTDASLAGTRIDSFAVAGAGNAAGHGLELTVTGTPGTARLALDGRVESPWQPGMLWHVSLAAARIEPSGHPGWRLESEAAGTFGAEAAELERTCLRQTEGSGRLCLEAMRSAERVAASFELSSLPLDHLTAFSPAPVTIEGTLDAAGDVAVDTGRPPVVDVRVSSTGGRVIQGADNAVALAFGALEGTLRGSEDTYTAALVWPLADSGRLELDGRLGAAESDGTRSLGGEVAAMVPDLSFVSSFSQEFTDVRGTLRADLTVDGTLDSPRVDGEVSLTDGAVTVPALEATYRDVSLTLNGDPAGDVDLEAEAASGGGSLTVAGRVSIANGGTGRLAASGEGFRIMDTADAMITVSPDLELTVTPERIEITGTVRVPAARITPAESGPEAVMVSSDEVIVGSGAAEQPGESTPRPLHATVELELGEDVVIEAAGLTGLLTGSLEITETPGEPTTGSGELLVEGTYVAYGQELQVRTGRLLFAGGPLASPGLDIEAVRRPEEDILVGARVRGTLEQPDLTLFSEPAMQQQDQLSYLVLGRPVSGASQSEQSALSRAAMALGLRGGNFVSERINESLGLDEFGIQTDPGAPASSASFVIGKYLSPSLYVSYGIGLFESVSSLNLRYRISDRWQILTESSSRGSGGDIIYSIERSSDRDDG